MYLNKLGLVVGRWLTAALCALVLCLPAVGARQVGGQGAEAKPAFERVASKISASDFGAPAGSRLLVVHYHRMDGNYTDWNLWSWAEGKDGKAHLFTGETAFGRYAVVPLPADATRAGFIVRKGNWADKDGDADRFVELAAGAAAGGGVAAGMVTEVWLLSGDSTIHRNPEEVDFSVRITSAFLDTSDRILLGVTGHLTHEHKTTAKLVGGAGYGVKEIRESATHVGGRVMYDVVLDRPVEAADVGRLSLSVKGFRPVVVYARDVLTLPEFTAADAVLGYEYAPGQTVFRTWSPVAERVSVKLFTEPTSPQAYTTVPMKAVGKGVWEATVTGDIAGQAYLYEFESYGKKRLAPDINTFAATPDSSRSVVVDLKKYEPAGWGTVPTPKRAHQVDEIVYEIHVRDFTIADETCPPEHRGTYLGLIHKNPAKNGKPASALSHVLELGATAVHLLPMQDFTASRGEYNWGYWTALFNVPECNYATDDEGGKAPSDAGKAILEFRTAVQGLHAAGVRVIMDVVYNHTSTSGENSPFDQSVPFYYFRTSPDGRLLNESGTGNAIADERPMVRKYIVDSLKHWTKQYRVDGYRFDLLGMHKRETVEAITKELLAIRPDLTLYGEPWTGGGPTHFPKGAQRGMAMGVFNDHLRNAVRGDLDGTSTGFATGPGGDSGAVARGVAGSIDDFALAPGETVNYASAHDNLTLWDKLVHTHPGAPEATKRSMHKLAQGIILTSQGMAFLHGGCDFSRTKGGNHNSYNAGDAVNAIVWSRKTDYADVYEYLRGLVAIRKAYKSFRMQTADEIHKNLRFLQTGPVIVFTLDAAAAGDPAKLLLVAYNGEPGEQTVVLPAGSWLVLADDQTAGLVEIGKAETSMLLPGYSMAVLVQK